jgi:superfamily I DNA/RNA helicase
MSLQPSSLDGTLHVLPYGGGGSLAARVRAVYGEALDAADGPHDVLVLKRLPNGVDEFTTALRDAADLSVRPNVKSLPRHATTVLDEADPDTRLLSYEERIEFLARVLDGYNWSSYFEQASQHDSFGRDVGQLLLDAAWQGGFDLPDGENGEVGEYDEHLRELADVNDAFHGKLDQRGLVEQADAIPRAIEALDRPGVRQQVEREFDAVVAVEFEECTAIDRAYLASLAQNADLHCVAESQASVERVKKEPGGVERLADGLTVVRHDDAAAERSVAASESGTDDAATKAKSGPDDAATEAKSGPDDVTADPDSRTVGRAFGTFLATGDWDGEATARLIAAGTVDEQVEEVANEIEYLRREHGWEYDDFAVLLRAVGDPMPRVRRILRHSGVPTAAAGVNGLEQDLAVRELHALARYHSDDERRALDLLRARVPDVDDELVEECVDPRSVAESLKRWIVTTDLKGRIAADSADINAREQFQNVARIVSIAEFMDEQDFFEVNWSEFVSMLRRAITYDAPYAHTAEVDVAEGGVTVGDTALVKNDSRKAVFLLNVVDSEYPGDETLSPLFPTTWITRMEGYPAVTRPTPDEVADTYATVADVSGDAFERYHAERARRQLAIGARAADERLYFCTYEQSQGTVGRRQHRSRYLHAVENCPDLTLETVEGAGEDRDIHTLGSASTEILSQPWRELERVQAEASTGSEDKVELESTEETLAAIQRVLDESEDVNPRFERAAETQFDLARGAVRPDENPGGTGGSE